MSTSPPAYDLEASSISAYKLRPDPNQRPHQMPDLLNHIFEVLKHLMGVLSGLLAAFHELYGVLVGLLTTLHELYRNSSYTSSFG